VVLWACGIRPDRPPQSEIAEAIDLGLLDDETKVTDRGFELAKIRKMMRVRDLTTAEGQAEVRRSMRDAERALEEVAPA
jgi:hypothetical protein